MKKVFQDLESMKSWINKPVPAEFKSNNDYMRFIMKLMSCTHYLLKISVSMAPNQEVAKRGYTKHKAIVVGHQVRLVKLFHGFTDHFSKKQLELALILVRLIYECTIKLEYLLKAKRSTFSNYIFTSYRAEKEILQKLNDIKKQRPLTNIEKVIIKKIKNRLKKDKISIKRLFANKHWNLDGKDFRQILVSLNKEADYSFLFGQGSSYIHGNWHEMSIYNIEKRGRYYVPNREFDVPDPQIALPVIVLVLQTTEDFVKWNKSDPDNYIRPIIKSLMNKSEFLLLQYCNEEYKDV